MKEPNLTDLRDYYDNTDQTDALGSAQLDTNTDADPMVGITIRFPASTLNAARSIATDRAVRVTALLREWIEQQLADEVSDRHVVSVADLRRLIAHSESAETVTPLRPAGAAPAEIATVNLDGRSFEIDLGATDAKQLRKALSKFVAAERRASPRSDAPRVGSVQDVVPNPSGGWDVTQEGAGRSSMHVDTQKQAIDQARQALSNAGGGEIRIHGRDGHIRTKIN